MFLLHDFILTSLIQNSMGNVQYIQLPRPLSREAVASICDSNQIQIAGLLGGFWFSGRDNGMKGSPFQELAD